MYPPGHVAVAWLTASVTGSERGWRMLFVVLGALLPDLIDKALWVSGLVPGTRGVGHSLLLWCALGLLALWGGTPRLVAVGGVGGEREPEDVLWEVEEVADDARIEDAGVERVAAAQLRAVEHDAEEGLGPRLVGG